MSLHDRPSAAELIEAVRSYLLDEVAPATNDRRARFRALIAANVLAVVGRELAHDDALEAAEDAALRELDYADGAPAERRRELCARIRSGAYDDPAANAALMAYARGHVAAKLGVANPAAAERYRTKNL
jgi:hypothetical protein